MRSCDGTDDKKYADVAQNLGNADDADGDQLFELTIDDLVHKNMSFVANLLINRPFLFFSVQKLLLFRKS